MKFYTVIFVAFILSGCNSFNKVKNQLSGGSPYEKYALSLEKAGLNKTEMAQSWKNAGLRAFNDSVFFNLPFSEALYFAASAPDARSYRFHAKEGQILIVKGTLKAKPRSSVFIDLFINDNSKWKQVAFADTSLRLKYEFEKDQECLIRVQPELLIDVFFTISVTSTPVLINPVSGASGKSIGSFYGDVREGGARKHEGVDIFAPKGTPVLAPADGNITRVGETKLGGKVIWMVDDKRRHSYYFAHLDSQLAGLGKIEQGDTLGTVGNTGNARLTPAHLHFGIYQSGSKDPLHYIKGIEQALKETQEDTSVRNQDFKVASKNAVVLNGPNAGNKVKYNLERNDYVKVIGYNAQWFRVQMPDKKEGYVPRKLIAPAERGKIITTKSSLSLMTEASYEAVPVREIGKDEKIELLAEYGAFKYVRDGKGKLGWVSF